PRVSLPSRPTSSGATFRSRLGILKKDTEFVEQDARYLHALTLQSDGMRDLVDCRVSLAVSMSKLAALPEILAAEYLKGRRERASDLLLTDLRCQTEEAKARAVLASAEQHLASFAPASAPAAHTTAGLTVSEIDELISHLPDMPEQIREAFSRLVNGRVK